jgi:alkanesulfonate monooxygenase SsuD/methylene tetrahydromethanopterin reductase-like flavin-dependent oxidoreductase (luciferase family)
MARQQANAWLGLTGEKIKEQMHGAEGDIDYDEIRRKLQAALLRAEKSLQVIVGTPKTVIPKLKSILSVLRTGIFIILSIQGPVGDDDRRTSMRLFAEEVIPALKTHAKEIGLDDPFERTPGSAKLASGAKRAAVVDRGPLAGLGFK